MKKYPLYFLRPKGDNSLVGILTNLEGGFQRNLGFDSQQRKILFILHTRLSIRVLGLYSRWQSSRRVKLTISPISCTKFMNDCSKIPFCHTHTLLSGHCDKLALQSVSKYLQIKSCYIESYTKNRCVA